MNNLNLGHQLTSPHYLINELIFEKKEALEIMILEELTPFASKISK
jgi:hypothetical protein